MNPKELEDLPSSSFWPALALYKGNSTQLESYVHSNLIGENVFSHLLIPIELKRIGVAVWHFKNFGRIGPPENRLGWISHTN